MYSDLTPPGNDRDRSPVPISNASHASTLYDSALAEAVEKRERDMSFKESISADSRLILYSLGFSGTIIMEGYGLAHITYLFSFATFNERFGTHDEVAGVYELPYKWRVLLPLVAQLGSLLGILLASPLAARFGCKNATLLMLGASTALVTMPFLASTVEFMMAGFFLQGIPWGVYQVVSPAYASEVASLQLRPILTTWNNLCWVLGRLIASGITKAFVNYAGDMSYRIPFALQWLFSAALLASISFTPESPFWYLQNGRIEEAALATRRLVRKGSPVRVAEKLALMHHTICQEASQDPQDTAAGSEKPRRVRRWLGHLRLSCLKGTDLRRTEISSVAWLIQATCGSSLIPWAPKLFEMAGLPTSDALSINIALPGAGVFGTLASWWLMRRAGSRTIYFWGLVVMAVLLAACGGFHYLPVGAGWAAGGVLIVYTAVYDLTIGPVCYSVVSELPSIRYRTTTLAIARGLYLLAGVANHVLTPKMLGTEETAWKWGARAGFLYGGVCLLGAIYTYWRLPETGGMSARELDILFQNKVSARRFSSKEASRLAAAGAAKALRVANTFAASAGEITPSSVYSVQESTNQ